MRKSLMAAIVAVLSLALAGVAIAATFVQHSTITLTAKKSGQPTGFNANIFSTFPGGTEPKAAKKLVVTFPSGTKFNLGKISPCKLSDAQIRSGKACPSGSQVGTGSATALVWPLALKVSGSVKAYVSSSKSMVVVVTVTSPKKQIIVIHENVSGAQLTIPVPKVPPPLPGASVILTGLKLNVPAKKSGKPVATAGKCTGGQFTVKTAFTYTDGSHILLSSSSACS
jgi:hypothetical protein